MTTAPAPDPTQGQAPVVEEAAERGALVAGIAERPGDRGLVEDDGGLLVAPREECLGERPGLLATDLLALLAGGRLDRTLEAIEAADERQRVFGPRRIGSEGLVEVPPAMGPAPDLDDVAGLVEMVVDRVGVGDEVTLVAGEQAVDGRAVVLVRVPVKDVPARRDEHPEVGPATLLLGLHEDTGGVDAQVRLREGVAQHRLDQTLGKVGQLLVPAADRRAREFEAVAGVDLLLPVERQVVLPAVDDGPGEQTGPSQAALDRPLRRLGGQDRRFVRICRRMRRGDTLSDKFRPHDPDEDERCGTMLDDLTNLLADPLEGVEAFALDLRRQHFDLDPRQHRRDRPTSRGPPPGRLGRRGRLLEQRFGRRLRSLGRFRRQQQAEHAEGELRTVGCEALGLISGEDAALE